MGCAASSTPSQHIGAFTILSKDDVRSIALEELAEFSGGGDVDNMYLYKDNYVCVQSYASRAEYEVRVEVKLTMILFD